MLLNIVQWDERGKCVCEKGEKRAFVRCLILVRRRRWRHQQQPIYKHNQHTYLALDVRGHSQKEKMKKGKVKNEAILLTRRNKYCMLVLTCTFDAQFFRMLWTECVRDAFRAVNMNWCTHQDRINVQFVYFDSTTCTRCVQCALYRVHILRATYLR